MKSRKKLWVSVALIMLATGAGIAGTWAYFTAQRTASQNKFTIGTLDLSVTSDNNVANEPFVVENGGEDGAIQGNKTWTIKNTGSLPGRLYVELSNVENKENGCNDQEKTTEPACDSDDAGELGGVVTATVALDGTDKASSTLATAQQDSIKTQWTAAAPVIIAPGQEKEVSISWNAPIDAYGNEIQSDSLTFNTIFRLVQQSASN